VVIVAAAVVAYFKCAAANAAQSADKAATMKVVNATPASRTLANGGASEGELLTLNDIQTAL